MIEITFWIRNVLERGYVEDVLRLKRRKGMKVIDREICKACLLLFALALVFLLGGQGGAEEPDVAPSDVSGQERKPMPAVSEDVKHDVSPELRSMSPLLPEPGEGEPREIPLFRLPRGKGFLREGDCSDLKGGKK